MAEHVETTLLAAWLARFPFLARVVSVFRSRLVPVPFLAGVAFAFLGCCAAGWVLGGINCFHDFVRFHPYIAPETCFFPTACQVRALGRSRLDPGKVWVVVGGNSVLQGVGQRPGELWTRHLQEELGDRFNVINFAQRGAQPSEFGEIAAEMLERDHPRLLFVTDCGSTTCPDVPDGETYRYFYWDAYYKGLVLPDSRREACLDACAKDRDKQGDAFAELKRGESMDAGLRFQDLWTTIAYACLSTVWTPATKGNFIRPRRSCAKWDCPPPPLEPRRQASMDKGSMEILRSVIAFGPQLVREPLADCDMNQRMRDCFPEACRGRTLMLVVRDSPRYISRLTAEEQAAYGGVFPAIVRALETGGMPALDVGADFSEMDYVDRAHLSEQGGRRLARDVAPKLRELAGRLGYLQGERR